MAPRPGRRRGPGASLYVLEPLELAVGWVFGAVGEPPEVAAAADPRTALEDAVLPALRSVPCAVAFSGGRDSSAVLATAVDVARRHGLPDPIPVTRQYPGHADADEVSWQEAMIAHLGLADWVRVTIRDECDLIGPHAVKVLDRFGLVWPFAAYTNVPVFEVARGGAVLTGQGGDNVFGAHRATAMRHLLSGSIRQRARAARVAPSVLAPRVVRTRLRRRTFDHQASRSWLRADARVELVRRLANDDGDRPMSWRKAIRRLPQGRSWHFGAATIQTIADDYDVEVFHPLFDARFLASVAAAGHPLGPLSRTHIMTEMFGDLVPVAVLSRRTKAIFNTTVMGRDSRQFATRWRGQGVDQALIDRDALRREWLTERPHAGTFGLLQAAWLASG